MSRITTCIFDLDGVICDTARYHYKAWHRLAASFGFELTHAHDEQLKGIGRMESLDKIVEWAGISLSPEEKVALCQKKNDWFLDFIQTISPADILPGVMEFLESLKAGGYKIALGSASKNAPRILEKLAITRYFDAIVDGNSAARPKPFPDIFLQGATLTNSKPSECVVFEDAQSGVEAALAGGMRVVGVGSGSSLAMASLVIHSFVGFSVHDLQKL